MWFLQTESYLYWNLAQIIYKIELIECVGAYNTTSVIMFLPLVRKAIFNYTLIPLCLKALVQIFETFSKSHFCSSMWDTHL